jgi:hypothetical protein
MLESGQRVEEVARTGNPHEQLVASRILECPAVWQVWENEHAGLMRTVSQQRRPPLQITALKSTCFSLIHRKALFEHLRKRQVRGQARQQIVGFFYRNRSYGHALIAEHENYLRSACSYLCSSYVGSAVILDGVFLDPMQRYEELYAEYFQAYCEGFLSSCEAAPPVRALLPYLKYQITQQRLAVMAMPAITPAACRDAALRRPTGDTEKLRVDALRAQIRDRSASIGLDHPGS